MARFRVRSSTQLALPWQKPPSSCADDNEVLAVTKTDRNGSFQFSRLPPGEYQIVVFSLGFQTKSYQSREMPLLRRRGQLPLRGIGAPGILQNLAADFVQIEGGMYGYGRAVYGNSRQVGKGSLLSGGEAFYNRSPWTHPDNYYKLNGLLMYSQGGNSNGLSFTARAYHGSWHSSDQIAPNSVPLVGFFRTLNPTDGGYSRYPLQGEWHRQGTSSLTKITGYGFYYDLNFFSDFTYYLTDPHRGHQFEQQDRRQVAGLDARHTIFGELLGHRVENTFGRQVRNDWIHNGLFQTGARVRVEKIDSSIGNTLRATTREDGSIDAQIGLYAENRVQ